MRKKILISYLGIKIYKFHPCIFTILLLSPLGKCMALHLKKLESPLPKNALHEVWLTLAQWFERIF